MGVSCEDYNQCQLAQPDLTAHTVSCAALPSSRTVVHIHTHTCKSCTHSPFLNLSLFHSQPLLFPLLSPPDSVSHTHKHTQWDAGCHYSVVTEHRGNSSGTKRLSLHSRCVCRPRRHDYGRICVYLRVTVDSTPNHQWRATRARVCQCVPLLLAFYLGTASEQFTACQSSCRSERQQEDVGKEEREERLTTVGGG